MIGNHKISGIRQNIATELDLVEVESFADHSFCHTSETEAASYGVTSIDLKCLFGWVQESTALKHIDGTKGRHEKWLVC